MSVPNASFNRVFDFVDLFAGVGGFHAALKTLGGTAVQAAEIDSKPASIYESNWGLKPEADVRDLAVDPSSRVPDHSVLVGGFPCQPFSKSGRQLGIAEERGTLFHDILTILEAKRPPVVMLENVRNIAGPRQREAWQALIHGLRLAGYKVSDTPCVFSPHLLAPSAGGSAQMRERVYILGVHVGVRRAMAETSVDPIVNNVAQGGWDPSQWSIADHVLLPELSGFDRRRHVLARDEEIWIDTWNELLARLGPNAKLPGFPMWEYCWRARRPQIADLPEWKQRFVRQNHDFYVAHRGPIDAWRKAAREVAITDFPASRRKLEWQAQDADRDLWKQLLQFRPSGIRVKRPTYTPTLVALNQTPIYGPGRRRLTAMETARLQGFDPESFTFGDQPDANSYKQMGNAVNVGAVRYVFQRYVEANAREIRARGDRGVALVDAVLGPVTNIADGAA